MMITCPYCRSPILKGMDELERVNIQLDFKTRCPNPQCGKPLEVFVTVYTRVTVKSSDGKELSMDDRPTPKANAGARLIG